MATAVITLSWSILHPTSLFSPIIIHPTKERNSISSIGTVFWVKNVLFVITQFCHTVNQCFGSCSWSHWSWQAAAEKLSICCEVFHPSVIYSHRLQRRMMTLHASTFKSNLDRMLEFWERLISLFELQLWRYLKCPNNKIYTVIIRVSCDLSNFCKEREVTHYKCQSFSAPQTCSLKSHAKSSMSLT